MTEAETVELLKKIAAYDQRTVGQADVLAWHESVGDQHLDVALEAVRVHHQNSPDRIKPFHVRTISIRLTNDAMSAANSNPEYRQAQERESDLRLAEKLRRKAGDDAARSVLPCAETEPADEGARQSAVESIRSLSSGSSNVQIIKALAIDWSGNVLDQVCSMTKIPRNEAAIALNTIDCLAKGVEPLKASERLTQPRQRRPQSSRRKQSEATHARQAATHHLLENNVIPMFGERDGVA